MIIISFIIMNILFTLFCKFKNDFLDVFSIISISSWYYVILVPILAINYDDILGFNLSYEVWEKYVAIGMLYNFGMLVAILTPDIAGKRKENFKFSPSISIIKITNISLLIFYAIYYFHNGTVIFNEHKYLNILSTLLIISAIMILPNSKSVTNNYLFIFSILIIGLTSFRVKLLLLLSFVVAIIFRNFFYTIIIIPFLIIISFFYENSRKYGDGIDLFKLWNYITDVDLSKFGYYIVNQGEATVSFYSAMILNSDVEYINFWDPYLYTYLKFIFSNEAIDPNLILISLYEGDFSSYGFAFTHFTELYLQGGVIGVFIGAYIYGLFFKYIQSFLLDNFITEQAKFLINFFAIFFGYYNYSRGHFFQIFSDFLIVIVFLIIANFKLKKYY